jgi:pimeloyl-ACP methyl ester carboxylesterase
MPDEDFKKMATAMAQNMTNSIPKVEVIANWSIIADRKTYVYGYTDLLKLDLREKLSGINIPTLILGASFPNKEIVFSNYQKQYANLKNKEILMAEGSKHFIMFDQPEWLYSQVNKYLAQYVR